MATKKTDSERIEALETAVLDLQAGESAPFEREMSSPYPIMYPEIMHLDAIQRLKAGESMLHYELEAVHRQLNKSQLFQLFPERFDFARLGYIMECFDFDTEDTRFEFAETLKYAEKAQQSGHLPYYLRNDKIYFEAKQEMSYKKDPATNIKYHNVKFTLSNDGFLYPEVQDSGLKTLGFDFAAHQARRRTEDRPWSILAESELSEKFPKVHAFANKWLGEGRVWTSTRVKYVALGFERLVFSFRFTLKDQEHVQLVLQFEPGFPTSRDELEIWS